MDGDAGYLCNNPFVVFMQSPPQPVLGEVQPLHAIYPLLPAAMTLQHALGDELRLEGAA